MMPPRNFDERLRSLESKMARRIENEASDRLKVFDLMKRLSAVEARFSETVAIDLSRPPSVDTRGGDIAVESEAYDEKGPHDAANAVAVEVNFAGTACSPAISAHAKETEAVAPDVVEYALSMSVWDGMFAIHHPRVGRGAAVLLFIAIFLNLIAQVSFCFGLVTSDDFNPGASSKFADIPKVMRRWRLTDGHDLSNRDRLGRSLVSRVCAGDGGLSIATKQAATLQEIDSYLGISQSGHFGRGPFLATVCIFYYCVAVIQDIREASHCILALMSLPRARCTQVSVNNEFVAVSWSCLHCNLIVASVRVVVALALLYVGVVWLATTTETQELILNASALCFVLTLDELLFHTIVPSAVKNVVREIPPLKVNRIRRNLEAFLPLAFVLVIPVAAYFTIVWDNIEFMMEVKEEMCGGNRDFVISKSGTRIMHALKTVPYSAVSFHETYDIRATDDLRHARSLTQNSRFDFVRWHHEVEETFQNSVREDWFVLPSLSPCENFDVAPFAHHLRNERAVYFKTSREIVDPDGTKGLSPNFACSEYKPFCDETTYAIIRWMCPLTCGCDNSTSGLLLGRKGPWGGCADACPTQVESLPCSDLSVTSTAAEDAADKRAWERYWKSYYNYSVKLAPSLASVFQKLIDETISKGCNAKAVCPVTGADFCNSQDTILVGFGARSIVSFCPETCCRVRGNASKSPDCPSAC
eukprot:TRINITY_DN13605_c0_g1_i3.p1 TRINITY_DN13605_c0_g1~~TRINITY_DN13605_c0_g1_i3.p1  ORF type:complete len:700 (+),score=72.21 TRINITY_DN13605_c0_g1_i3:127-2226(+)